MPKGGQVARCEYKEGVGKEGLSQKGGGGGGQEGLSRQKKSRLQTEWKIREKGGRQQGEI